MKRFVNAILFSLLLAAPTSAAEHNGRNVDGIDYDCTAFSYDTGKYYEVEVEFDGDEAIIKFQGGGHLTLTLDDEDIDDASSISAFDYKHGVYWDLDVPNLEDE